MCEGRVINNIIPPHLISGNVSASDMWPNSLAAPPLISVHHFIPHRRSRPLSASHLWPKSIATQVKQSEEDMGITRTPHIVEQDKSMLRFVKRSRTTPDSGSGCGIQMEPQPFSFINIGYNQEHTSWSLNAERLPGRTDNEKEIHWDNNLEERLAGKRKICDLDNTFKCSWPLFTETLDEEDNDGVSDSDSDTFSGPS